MLNLNKNEERALLAIIIVLVLGILLYRFVAFKSSNVALIEKGEEPQHMEEVEELFEEEKEPAKIYVYVTGEIKKPGLYILKAGDRVGDAISMAGGFTGEADITSVNLAEKLKDEQFIKVLKIGEDKGQESQGNGSVENGKININKATAEELADFLPGIGEVYAKNIVSYRDKNGRFESIDELRNVSGIGPKRFENIKDLVTVN